MVYPRKWSTNGGFSTSILVDRRATDKDFAKTGIWRRPNCGLATPSWPKKSCAGRPECPYFQPRNSIAPGREPQLWCPQSGLLLRSCKIFALAQDVVTCSGSWFANGHGPLFAVHMGFAMPPLDAPSDCFWRLLTLRKAHKVQRFLQTFQKWKVQAGVRSHKIWSSKGRGGTGFYGAMGVVMHGGILVPQCRPSHMVRALLRRRLCSSGT